MESRHQQRPHIRYESEVEIIQIDNDLLPYERSLEWDYIAKFFQMCRTLRRSNDTPLDRQLYHMLDTQQYAKIEKTYGAGSRAILSVYVSGYERVIGNSRS